MKYGFRNIAASMTELGIFLLFPYAAIAALTSLTKVTSSTSCSEIKIFHFKSHPIYVVEYLKNYVVSNLQA